LSEKVVWSLGTPGLKRLRWWYYVVFLILGTRLVTWHEYYSFMDGIGGEKDFLARSRSPPLPVMSVI